jgi:hypothetical protein
MRMSAACLMLALGLTATQATASDEERPRLNGAWNVAVAIRNCETGEVIRNVRAVNLFVHDGSLVETSSNSLRSSSVGTWSHRRDRTYTSMFVFFRYNPDGTFATTARVRRTIELSEDGTQFVTRGTVEDFDAQNVRVSVGCSTEAAVRAR